MKTLILTTAAAATLLGVTGQLSAGIAAGWTFAILAGLWLARDGRR